MNDQRTQRVEEANVEMLRWMDKYTDRVATEMRRGWVKLETEMKDTVAAHDRDSNLEAQLRRAITQWLDAHVRPIINDATQDLSLIASQSCGVDSAVARLQGPDGLAADLTVVVASIDSFLRVFLFQSSELPHDRGLLQVVLGFRVTRIGQLFANTCVPRIKAALVGDGYTQDGEPMPSLRAGLIKRIEVASDQRCERLRRTHAAEVTYADPV